VRRLKLLEKENERLEKLVADLSVDNAILKDVAEGNFTQWNTRRSATRYLSGEHVRFWVNLALLNDTRYFDCRTRSR
jgi:hypothetical protein